MTILAVRTPASALIAAWRADPELRGKPLILGGHAGERVNVEAASDAARACGVTVGMALRQAEQCCPQAVFQPVDRPGAQRVGQLLRMSLYAMTPEVSADAPDGMAFLRLDGLSLRWPDRSAFLEEVRRRVRKTVTVSPALGVAPGLFVSRLAAERARPGSPIIVESAPSYLKPLPISCLPLDDDLRECLELLGLKTLGSLQAIPRLAFQRQFGAAAARTHDLACGIDIEPFRPFMPPPRIEEDQVLDPPLDNLEALQFVVRALADRVGEQLSAGGLGAREVLVRLDQDAAPSITLSIGFAYPLTAAGELFDGIRARILRSRPVAPLERVTLGVRQLESAYVRQPGLLLRRDGMQETLADAVARLREEFRPALVQQAAIVREAPPIPERRIAWSCG